MHRDGKLLQKILKLIVARIAGSGYRGVYMTGSAANIVEGRDPSFDD